ncbi:hypothetical protein THAOC_13017, partial [Thalassiosira oceanica]
IDDEENCWWSMISKGEMSGAPALMIFAFWWTLIIAAPMGATEIARLWSADAFAHNRAGRRTLPAQLPRTTTSRRRVTATPSSGPSLLLATKHSDTWELRYKELVKYKEEHGDCDVPHCSPRSHTRLMPLLVDAALG